MPAFFLKVMSSGSIALMVTATVLLLGLIFGSFVNALVWRLHEQKDWLRGRSECVHCHHVLAAKDLLPIVSWVILKGRCRYCHKRISIQYPLVEFIMAATFGISYIFWPLPLNRWQIAVFILWLAMLLILVTLALYDLKWRLLPNKLVTVLAFLAVVSVGISVAVSNHSLLGHLWGLIIIGGLFYLLFQLSGGRWIGGGDVKLGAVLGFLSGGPLNSILLLLMASTAGTLYALPFIAKGQANRKTTIPFGPFLIISVFFVMLFGRVIITWYKSLYS